MKTTEIVESIRAIRSPSKRSRMIALGSTVSPALPIACKARSTSRSKDIIISGGENISSLEVEDALHRHPAVLLAAVVAQPDAKWGEVPCAFVEIKPGSVVTEAELIELCRTLLARFKVPKRIVFGELPKTSTGKIQKFLLRAQVRSSSAIE